MQRFSMTSAGTQTEPLDGWRHEASGPSFAVPTARDGARPDPRFATAPMPEAAEMPDLPKRAFYGGGFRANKEESVEADHRARRTPSFISGGCVSFWWAVFFIIKINIELDREQASRACIART